MKVNLFTIKNCVACAAHAKEVYELLGDENIELCLIDVDDERYLYMALNAMKKYNIDKTPSMVLLRDNRELIACISGIPDSIETLKRHIDEERTRT